MRTGEKNVDIVDRRTMEGRKVDGSEAIARVKALSETDRAYLLYWLASKHPATVDSGISSLELHDMIAKEAAGE
jgi:hypothetical protein